MEQYKKYVNFCSALLLSAVLFGCEVGDFSNGFVIEVNKGEGLRLTSDSFLPGDKLPDAYTCEGKNFGDGQLPALSWTPGPEGTKSYVVVFKDLTLEHSNTPDYAFHWAIWDIPASITSLPEGLEDSPMPQGLGGAQQLNGGPDGAPVFLGPCPSWQNACDSNVLRSLDVYAFTVYAMNVEKLNLPNADPTIGNYVRQLDAYFQSVAIGRAELLATSDASPSTAPAFCPAPQTAE